MNATYGLRGPPSHSSLLLLSSSLLHHDKSMETLAIGKLFSILDTKKQRRTERSISGRSSRVPLLAAASSSASSPYDTGFSAAYFLRLSLPHIVRYLVGQK